MTISNTTARTSATGTNVAGQEIPFTFPVTSTGDLTVITRVTATGVETTLVEITDYTVALTDSGESGGTVTLVSALATTSQCHVIRDRLKTQTLDLEQGGAFNAENVEDAIDRVCTHTIDNDDAINRSLRAPQTDATSIDMELPNSIDRASQYLAFDADGEPTVVASVAPSTATITAWAETFLDDASAADARTTLGVEIGADVQAWDNDLDDLSALAHADGNMIVSDGTDWTVESGATLRTSIGCPAASDTPLVSTIVVDRDSGNIITDRNTGNIVVTR